jgi:hypothetical protein
MKIVTAAKTIWLFSASLAAMCALPGCGDSGTGSGPDGDGKKRMPAFELSATSAQILEGAQKQISVRLKEAPTADVELVWQTSDARLGTVSPSVMTFTKDSWGTFQTLTLEAPQDDVANGERSWRASAQIRSGDPLYAQLVEPLINAITQDDDSAGFALTPLELETTEAGGEASFTIRLTSKPLASVTIALVSDDTAEGEATPSALAFTPQSWDQPQEVTVRGKDDMVADGDAQYQIVFIAARSDDPAYSGLRASPVRVTNIDGVCRNGVKDGAEQCDEGMAPQQACAYGEMSCMVCSAQCTQVAGALGGFCGDGALQGPETCDGAALSSCGQRGFSYGQTACDACQIDESGCYEVVQVALGRAHSCALNDRGGVVCWGANDAGQSTPPATLPGQGRIAAGGDITCSVVIGGALTCWGGRTVSGVVNVVDVGVGDDLICWLDTMNHVTCQGADDMGQATPPPGQTFTALAVGARHACGIKLDGTALCWGDPGNGRLVPPATQAYTELAAGGRHTCARKVDGKLECWGDNREGQTNAPADAVFNVFSAGEDFTCGRFMDGALQCWGRALLRDAAPPGEYDVMDAGSRHACARRTNGEVLCWGDEESGQSMPPARSI